jgi:hypothetical protein
MLLKQRWTHSNAPKLSTTGHIHLPPTEVAHLPIDLPRHIREGRPTKMLYELHRAVP